MIDVGRSRATHTAAAASASRVLAERESMMTTFTLDDLIEFLSPYPAQLPEGAVLSGRVIVPGTPAQDWTFLCRGGEQAPAVGASEIDDPKAPALLYNIGSTTKTFTATMLAQSQGGDPSRWGTVGDYLGFLALPSSINDIPLIDLAHYTSGFEADNVGSTWLSWNGKHDLFPIHTLSQFSQLLSDNDRSVGPLPQNTPGTYYTYSNLGYGLLGLCLSGVSGPGDDVGEMWNAALQNAIGQCGLSMPNTRAYQCLTEKQRAGMVGFEGSTKVSKDLTPNTVMYVGSGAVTTTLGDMGNWLLFNMGYPAGSIDDARNLMQTNCFSGPAPSAPNGPLTYTGLGWFLTPPTDPPRPGRPGRVFKNGAVKGFSSFMSFKTWASVDGGQDPSDTGVVLLANFRKYPSDSGELDATAIGSKLMSLLMGSAEAEHPSAAETPFDL